MMTGPSVIHQSFSTFGDGEYAVDPRVVRRIRQEFDPFFCPLFRLQVWKWPDGSVKKFKNFGVGASSREDVPKNPRIMSAMRPSSGYLSKIEPAADIVVWWPFGQNDSGTPEQGVAFSDNIYYHVKRTFERVKELEYQAKQIAKTQTLTFGRELLRQDRTDGDAELAFQKSEAAYRLKQEIPIIRKNIENTTKEDIEKLYDKATAPPKLYV